jgi:hypothetical protein
MGKMNKTNKVYKILGAEPVVQIVFIKLYYEEKV